MDMDMGSTLPTWMTPLAWVVLTLALISSAVIADDIYRRGHRHHTVATELVWIASGLYLGPFALLAYRRHGRDGVVSDARTAVQAPPGVSAGLPGGGASAAAHLIGVPLVIASGLTIAGIDLWVMIIVIALLATAMLFAYERSAVTPTVGARDTRRPSVAAALGAAAVTVLAFDLGMGGWMLLLHFTETMPPATDAAFWLLMQVGIVLGVITGYPAVRLLRDHRNSPA
ncbi:MULTISPECIES: DUF4396 domain-containing protein [unclassified Rhodococcus (in: high G+C Gram-positive bacteria)]|uniref:DUF4396 domain-containing protein n=1 Tax=unclassified Rhodococcus (in: high G+C Gram-positive bacteria) TaxID=192944 RepID=UPI001C9AE292|nr:MULTISPECIES: DUF4396 domain-containing protein [unclassified Rhodococcus (in: high G+C Gram-positive bacteria)]MBY6709173.1 DUF4396 domain-containing protein [Rhodococcus sp. BP-241]